MTDENRNTPYNNLTKSTSQPPAAIIGMKFDDGKLRYSLLPDKLDEKIIEVLEIGADKYCVDNWKLVDNARERYYNAAMRHIRQWYYGESLDKETGKHHLIHAICCLSFIEYLETKG